MQAESSGPGSSKAPRPEGEVEDEIYDELFYVEEDHHLAAEIVAEDPEHTAGVLRRVLDRARSMEWRLSALNCAFELAFEVWLGRAVRSDRLLKDAEAQVEEARGSSADIETFLGAVEARRIRREELDALERLLAEIPGSCRMAQHLSWAKALGYVPPPPANRGPLSWDSDGEYQRWKSLFIGYPSLLGLRTAPAIEDQPPSANMTPAAAEAVPVAGEAGQASLDSSPEAPAWLGPMRDAVKLMPRSLRRPYLGSAALALKASIPGLSVRQAAAMLGLHHTTLGRLLSAPPFRASWIRLQGTTALPRGWQDPRTGRLEAEDASFDEGDSGGESPASK